MVSRAVTRRARPACRPRPAGLERSPKRRRTSHVGYLLHYCVAVLVEVSLCVYVLVQADHLQARALPVVARGHVGGAEAGEV